MIWLAIWAFGIPVAHALDHDRTDTRLERACEAAAWPVVIMLLVGVGIAGGIGLIVSLFHARKEQPCAY